MSGVGTYSRHGEGLYLIRVRDGGQNFQELEI